MDFHKIQSSDFQGVVDLLDESFQVSRELIERDLKEIQGNPKTGGDIYGLWVDETLVGTVVYGAIYGTPSCQSDEAWEGEGEIRYLAIDPKHRRKGYATWIIKKAIEDLKQVGSPCVAVSVLAGDKVAEKIWEGFGFKKDNEAYTTDEYGTHDSYALWF